MSASGSGGYGIRDANGADVAVVTALWREFRAETTEPDWRAGNPEAHLAALGDAIGTDLVLIAERQGEPVGLAVAEPRATGAGYLHILFVRPEVRRSGVAAALLREVAKRFKGQGLELLELDVLASNTGARSVYQRWGFSPVELTLAAPLGQLVDRL